MERLPFLRSFGTMLTDAPPAIGGPRCRRRAARRLDASTCGPRRPRTSRACARSSPRSRRSRAGSASSAPASTSTAPRTAPRRRARVVAARRARSRGRGRRPRHLRRQGPDARRSRSRSPTPGMGTASPPCCSRTSRRPRRAADIDDVHGDRHALDNHRMLQVFHDSGFPVSVRAWTMSSSSSSRPRCRRRRGGASRIASAPPTSRRSRTCCGPPRSRSSARLAGPGPSAARSCATCSPAGFSGPLHLVNAQRRRGRRPTDGPLDRRRRGRRRARRHRRAGRRRCSRPRASAPTKGVRALVVLTAGLRRGRRRGPRAAGRAARRLPGRRHAHGRPELPRRRQPPSPDHAQRHVRARRAVARQRRVRLPERRRSGSPRSTRRRRAGSGSPPSSRWATRPTSPATTSSSTGSRTPTPPCCSLYLESFGNPRRFGRIARRITQGQAGRRGQERPHGGRPARRVVAHRGAACGLRRHRRRAVRPCRRAARRDGGGDVRRRGPARAPAAAARRPRGGADQRRRPGDPVRGRVRGRGPPDRAARPPPRARASPRRCPPEASTANPVDMIASATRGPVRALAAHPARRRRGRCRGDDLRAARSPRARPRSPARIAAAAEGADRPVLAVWLGADTPGGRGHRRVPRFATPEEAVRALAHAVRLRAPPRRAAGPAVRGRRRRHRDRGDDRRRGARARRRLAAARRRRATAALLGHPAGGEPRRRHGAGRRAAPRRSSGGPVALKAIAPGVVHKSDAGAVRLGLTGPTAVTRAAREMAAQLQAAGPRRGLPRPARWRPAGTELIVGAVGDPAFGPLVACGAGGVAVELLGDVQVRLAPLGPREADGMLRGLKTFPLLDGYRGRPQADLELAARPRHARRRAGGDAPGDRRARPQPGHRHARGRARRRRARPARGARSRAGVPVAQRLSTTADYGTTIGASADAATARPA